MVDIMIVSVTQGQNITSSTKVMKVHHTNVALGTLAIRGMLTYSVPLYHRGTEIGITSMDQ